MEKEDGGDQFLFVSSAKKKENDIIQLNSNFRSNMVELDQNKDGSCLFCEIEKERWRLKVMAYISGHLLWVIIGKMWKNLKLMYRRWLKGFVMQYCYAILIQGSKFDFFMRRFKNAVALTYIYGI